MIKKNIYKNNLMSWYVFPCFTFFVSIIYFDVVVVVVDTWGGEKNNIETTSPSTAGGGEDEEAQRLQNVYDNINQQQKQQLFRFSFIIFTPAR